MQLNSNRHISRQVTKMSKNSTPFSVSILITLALLLSGCMMLPTPSPISHQDSETTTPNVSSTTQQVVTSTPNADSVPTCHDNGAHIYASENLEINGTIIYQNFDYSGLFTLGGSPIINSQLFVGETQQSIVFGFSPDGEWIAYSPINTSTGAKFDSLEVVLLSTRGERIVQHLTTSDFDNELQIGHQLVGVSADSYWINSELIYVTLYSQNPDPNTSGLLINLPKVLSPFDAKWSNQYLDLPGRLSSQEFGISPDGSKSLYEENGLTLWDYLGKTQIWHDNSLTSPFQALIVWNSDSSIVAYASLLDPTNNETVFLVTSTGKYKPIVNKTFPIPGFSILNLSWSPDGNYLALAGRHEESLIIVIYDVKSGKYISQCPIGESNGIRPTLVWSPDNSLVAISDIDSPILIFDLDSESVFELTQYGRVLGWSDKFPRELP